jgi:hypothetical protein
MYNELFAEFTHNLFINPFRPKGGVRGTAGSLKIALNTKGGVWAQNHRFPEN